MKSQATPRDCFAAALRLLARRDHSRSELSGKLAQRGFSQDQVQWALDRCLHFHYLDDDRFARIYIEQLQSKGYGCHRIRQMLESKGVAQSIVSARLEPLCCDAVQTRDCRKAMTKKIKSSLHAGDSAAAKVKLYRFLLNRGFPAAVIRQIMDEGVGDT